MERDGQLASHRLNTTYLCLIVKETVSMLLCYLHGYLIVAASYEIVISSVRCATTHYSVTTQ